MAGQGQLLPPAYTPCPRPEQVTGSPAPLGSDLHFLNWGSQGQEGEGGTRIIAPARPLPLPTTLSLAFLWHRGPTFQVAGVLQKWPLPPTLVAMITN